MGLESKIIKAIYAAGEGLTFKQLSRAEGISGTGENKLKKTLKSMAAERIIEKGKKERYCLRGADKMFTGTVVSLAASYGFIRNNATNEDYFVRGGMMKAAIPGDIVIARQIKPKNEHLGAAAAVAAILQKTDKVFSGVITGDKKHRTVTPDSFSAPPLRIARADGDIKPGSKVLFSVVKRGSHHSEHIVNVESAFGSAERARACTKAYLAENRIPVEFSDEALVQARKIEEKGLSEKEKSRRLDLRDTPIFTIDGADTKDIDDAVSIEKTDDGYRLGVHIADVSYYVKEGSPLDSEVFKRGTSVYIADTVVPMLPKELSNGICSLNPGVDRLAFSCLMEISKKGKLKKFKFKKTVIRSRVQGVYSEVNAIIDGSADKAVLDKYREVSHMIPVMKELAAILKKNRENRGAPEISSDESKVICDKDGVCIDIRKRVGGVSENIIEEFMLAANNAAASLAMDKQLPFVYRVHEDPAPEKIEALRQTLDALGVVAVGIGENSSAADFARLLKSTADAPEFPIINRLVLRTMSKAKYSEKPIGHFGLVMDEYAHFTSPIRRCADLSVHRVLSDYVAKRGAEKIKKHYERFAENAAKTATQTELSAVAAERTCESYYAAEYMKKHIGEEYDAMISGVLSGGFFAALDNTVEGRVDTDTLTGDYQLVNGIMLYNALSGRSFTIGDRVRVKCVNADVSTGQIDFELADGG